MDAVTHVPKTSFPHSDRGTPSSLPGRTTQEFVVEVHETNTIFDGQGFAPGALVTHMADHGN